MPINFCLSHPFPTTSVEVAPSSTTGPASRGDDFSPLMIREGEQNDDRNFKVTKDSSFKFIAGRYIGTYKTPTTNSGIGSMSKVV